MRRHDLARAGAAAWAVSTVLATATPAWAHGFAGPGWLHPLTGPDHMLAMLAVGAWSAQLGGRATWSVPVAFVAAMAAGGALGLLHLAVPFTEIGIAASVLALGLAIGTRTRLSTMLAALAVGLFGACHGYAHGLEMPRTTNAATYTIGFLGTTAALHVVGLVATLLVLDRRHGAIAMRLSGVAVAVAGAMLLLPLLNV